MSKVPRRKLLFICTGNACRSQMVEGWVKKLRGGSIEVYSAGIEKHGLDPRAVEVMAEVGVDISSQYSKLISELDESQFDCVITICNRANENCPAFPGKTKRLHHSFENPPLLAKSANTEEEALDIYRRIRDEIREYI